MTGAPLLELDQIHRRFSSEGRAVDALQGATLSLWPGETLGLLGESGSGKTTLGRIAVGLDRPDSGRILINGADITLLGPNARRRHFQSFQLIFQDPYSSLNPCMTVGQQIGEVLRAHGGRDPRAIRVRVGQLLDQVDLPPSQIDCFPHQLSGGQRQRAAIARALAPSPALIVADEPTSALDASIRLSVLDLLTRIQKETGVAYLLISHDIAAVARLSDRIAVVRHGCIVECSPARDLLLSPIHPYTTEFLSYPLGASRGEGCSLR